MTNQNEPTGIVLGFPVSADQVDRIKSVWPREPDLCLAVTDYEEWIVGYLTLDMGLDGIKPLIGPVHLRQLQIQLVNLGIALGLVGPVHVAEAIVIYRPDWTPELTNAQVPA